MPATKKSSVARDEIAQFSRHAHDWWNPSGAFRPLHKLNPVRVGYIRDQAAVHFLRSTEKRFALKGLEILDVGCGGGLLAEPLSRLGAKVTGLDASAESVATAKAHAEAGGLAIQYSVSSVEELATKKRRFDMITALEIVEHVADLDAFLGPLTDLLKPGGLLVMSTLNRTPKSFLLGIVAAEYILKWVPRGTHQWKKFLKPSELMQRLEELGLAAQDITGLVFNPVTGGFELSRTDLDVNYLLTATKPS